MTAFIQEIRALVHDLNDIGVNWALIGALAYSAYGEPRTTKDIDVAVAVIGKEGLEDIVKKLLTCGYSRPESLMHMSPTYQIGIRIFIPSSNSYQLPLDLLNNSSGIEQEVVKEAQSIEILPALFLPVACLGHMIAMKILSQNAHDRIRDRSDLISLLSKAKDSDLEVARYALSLITERGFNRGKDLNSVLNHFLVPAS